VLAIIALAVAGVGLLLSFVPLTGWVSGILLLGSFVLAIVALALKSQGGKPLSIAALAISVLGWIIAIVVALVSVFLAAVQTAQTIDEGFPGPGGPFGEQADPVPAAEAIELVETAFGRDSFDPEVWWYVVILDNPDVGAVYEFSDVTIEAVDAAGTILDTSTDYLTILPGQVALVGSFYEVGSAEIAALQVSGPDPSAAVSAPTAGPGTLDAAELTATSDDVVTEVTGTVSGTFAEDQEYVGIAVVARDPGGEIIGGTSAFVERLPAEGAATFEATFFTPLPGDTTYEAYPFL
jgi:hypothetical protein